MTKELEPLVSISKIQLITGCNFTTAERMQRIIERKAEERYKRTCKMEPHPDYDLVTCSICGYEEERLILIPTVENASFDGKFCPNCGAEVIE